MSCGDAECLWMGIRQKLHNIRTGKTARRVEPGREERGSCDSGRRNWERS